MSSKQKVAIIGLGNIGKAVALNLVNGNREIIVASKNMDDARTFAVKSGDLVTPLEIEQAVKAADIIIPAVWFTIEQEFVKNYAASLKGKILIDVSNPIALADNGGFKKIIDENQSSGQIINELAGEHLKVVKTFGTLGAENLNNAAHKQPKYTMFYATNHKDVTNTIDELINDAGFDALNIGDINQSIRIEVFGDLHEYGTIGKPVTLTDAKLLL